MSPPAAFYCSPDYYFCIKEYARNEPYGDYRYLGVVKLGPLSTDEADMIFQEAVRPLIDVINQTPGYGYSDRVHLRSIAVTKNGFDEQYYELRSEYDIDDKRILLRWKMMSDSFLRDRYQDSLRQLDQMGTRKPTNDTILATAVRAAELILQKPLSVEYAVSPLPSQEKDRQLIPRSHEANMCSASDESAQMTEGSPKAEKTLKEHGYSEEDKEKMIDRAIAFKRRFPWATNIVVAFHVARKWEGFKNNHLSRFGREDKLSKRYQRFVEAQKNEVKRNITVQRGDSDNITPKDEAEYREYDRMVSDYLAKIGVPADLIKNNRQEVISYLTKSINGFDQDLSNAILGEGYIIQNEGHAEYSEKNGENKDENEDASQAAWFTSQNYVPARKDIRAFVKAWVKERNCAMD